MVGTEWATDTAGVTWGVAAGDGGAEETSGGATTGCALYSKSHIKRSMFSSWRRTAYNILAI